jgi:hypothetical protein
MPHEFEAMCMHASSAEEALAQFCHAVLFFSQGVEEAECRENLIHKIRAYVRERHEHSEAVDFKFAIVVKHLKYDYIRCALQEPRTLIQAFEKEFGPRFFIEFPMIPSQDKALEPDEEGYYVLHVAADLVSLAGITMWRQAPADG